VSGVVLFAKTSKGASRVSQQIRTREVGKYYEALVEGEPQSPRATLRHYLSQGPERVMVAAQPGPGRSEAVLEYELVRSAKAVSLLRIRLRTGRKHQIRSQLAAMGTPIVGDERYGARLPFPDAGIGLVFNHFRLKHPTQPERSIEIDLPPSLCPIARYGRLVPCCCGSGTGELA
jgi:23S rRNA pseudouridine1911/1915/1917 synthase